MATNSRNQSGRDYMSWAEAAREQRQEQKDRRDYAKKEDKIASYLKSHPSASWAEANYKTRGS